MSALPSLCLTPENALASTEAHLPKCGLKVTAEDSCQGGVGAQTLTATSYRGL